MAYQARNRSQIKTFLTIVAFLATQVRAIDVTATELPEMVLLSDLQIPDKSSAYFTLTVTNNTYSRESENQGHLALTAYATSFMSDPDIYISKTEHVQSATEADWHSAREGSDTSIIHKDDYSIGDTLYITISCMNACDYDLRMFYAREFEIADSERTLYRWGGHSTVIVKYKVPTTSSSGAIRKFDINFAPEVDHKFMEVYLSHDYKFSVIEDRPASHITNQGLSVLMTSADTRWCINCYVYLIVNMVEDRRVYVTATARTSNTGLVQKIDNHLLANEGQFECEGYSIQGTTLDTMFIIENYQGTADVYLAKRNQPSSPTSSSIVMSTKLHAPQQVILANQEDREYWDAELGIYYICAKAYDALSQNIRVYEEAWNRKNSADTETVYNFLLHKDNTQQFLYSKSALKTSQALIQVTAAVYENGNGDTVDIRIYYRLCTSGDCYLSKSESKGLAGGVELLYVQRQTSESDVETSFDYTGIINHDPALCKGKSKCEYVFSAYNPSTFNTPRPTTFSASISTEKVTDVIPGQAIKSTVIKGKYKNYRLLDSKYDLDQIFKLQLNLKTYLGDADLFVSDTSLVRYPTTEEYTYASRQNDRFDQVTITDTVNTWLSDELYISVYGELYSEFELTILVEYHPIRDERLGDALPLVDGVSIYNQFTDQYGYAFYAFSPWWSMHEQKTMVMLADSPLQEVDFYLAKDDFPMIYMTKWIDWNEMFALKPDQKGYTTADGFFGTFYVRVRPKFSLADILNDRPYSYYFRAFSQPTGNAYTDIHQNDVFAGVAYQGQNTFYRHFINDKSMTIKVTLERLQGKGIPSLLIKYDNNKVFPMSSDPLTYDKKISLSGSRVQKSFSMSQEWRASDGHPDCDYAGYWQNGGNEICTLYIGVECQELEEMCAFKIKLELLEMLEGATEETSVTRTPAKYITKDQDYLDVDVRYARHTRLFYPVVPEETGDILIFANKTASIGQSGDFSLVMNFEPDASQGYLDWNYAANYAIYRTLFSQNNNPVQPELIEISKKQLEENCNVDGEPNDRCALMISLRGETNDGDINARVRVFTGTNKLFPDTPVSAKITGKGQFKYYWFLSNGAQYAWATQDFWQHTIALGVKTKGTDFDLYVSVMDGRYPMENDYDFRSTNFGADSVYLSADDPMFRHDNPDSWDPSVGMVVVVGVMSLQEEESEFSLVFNGPKIPSYTMTKVKDTAGLRALPADPDRSDQNPYVEVFHWYNWGHNNFQVDVKAFTGEVSFFLNRIGQTNYQENVYSGIALNESAAEWSAKVNATLAGETQAEVTIMRGDTDSSPQFCYNCEYFVTAVVQTAEETEFRVWFQQLNDNGISITELQPGKEKVFSFEGKGDKSLLKFIMKSKDSFETQLSSVSGEIRLNIGLDPDRIDEDPLWSLTLNGKSGAIRVATDDPNFHYGTYYFASIEQLSSGSAGCDFEISQLSTVDFLANSVSKKMQFTYEQELVKFAVFEIPSTWSFHSRTVIKVEQLSQHIYPGLFLKKIETNTEPERLEDLDYPSLDDFDFEFGSDILGALNESKKSYEFETKVDKTFTYYTMAIYQNTYGLTDRRKPEFKLTVTTEYVSASQVLVSSPLVSGVEEVFEQ